MTPPSAYQIGDDVVVYRSLPDMDLRGNLVIFEEEVERATQQGVQCPLNLFSLLAAFFWLRSSGCVLLIAAFPRLICGLLFYWQTNSSAVVRSA